MSYAIGHTAGGGGKTPTLEALSITENGTYRPIDGVDGFNVVDVNVQPELDDITITENGVYRGLNYYRSYNIQLDIYNTKAYKVFPVQVHFATKDEYDAAPTGYNIKSAIRQYPEVIALCAEQGKTIWDIVDAWGGYDASTVKGYGTVTVDVQGGDIEPVVLSGDLSYAFHYPTSQAMAERIGLKNIHTENVTNLAYTFSNNNTVEDLSDFEINPSNSVVKITYLFQNDAKLRILPRINDTLYVKEFGNLFDGCRQLRYVEEFSNHIVIQTGGITSAGRSNLFNNCSSLRRVPNNLIDNNAMWCASTGTSNGYNPYYWLFYNCNSLDEVDGLGVDSKTWTSNRFNNTFSTCCRVNKITFLTNEDGTAQIANWKAQVIDLSNAVGYASGTQMILSYNSGITADKEVKDDESYAALKNDPDWFTATIDTSGHAFYSRYNKTSAVETINSLPDTSAYLATAGGTNTIKFKGEAGSATDGGAINTMTEAEIAVAAAKGWTVSFV